MHLNDPAVRVVEVDVSPLAYDEWHIETASLWNLYQDLKDADYRPVEAAAIERLLARSGIGPDSTVVFYGYAPAVGFWLMKLYGHADVRILNCSRDAWRHDGRPGTSAPPEPARPAITCRNQTRCCVRTIARCSTRSAIPTAASSTCGAGTSTGGSASGLPAAWTRPGRAGHVPSAVHQPIDGLYDERGSFRPVADLRGVFSAVDLDGPDELITYCTIGGRACTAWFVPSYLLGRDRVRVYDGSWAEWGRMPAMPAEQA